MIDALVSVIDRLIQLKKYQSERSRQIYSELFEPVFNELSAIHSNYIQIFTQLTQESPFAWERNTPGYLEKLKNVLLTLQQSRIEMEPARRQIRFMAKELCTIDCTHEARAFIDSVINYLFETTNVCEEDRNLISTASKSLSETIVDSLLTEIQVATETSEPASEFGGNPEIDIRNLIESTLAEQRSAWNAVCGSFSKLKISVALKD